jgi:hypothetical protein
MPGDLPGIVSAPFLLTVLYLLDPAPMIGAAAVV